MSTPSRLGINDLNEIVPECKQLSANWDMIGLNLGVTSATIETIKRDNPNSSERCMSQMLAKWLQRENEKCVPSWRSLCQALCDVDRTIANQIAQKHDVTEYIEQRGGPTQPDHPLSMYQKEMCGCGACTIKDWQQGRKCIKPNTEEYPKFVLLNPKHAIATHFHRPLSKQNEMYAMTKDIDDKFRACSVLTWCSLKCEVEGKCQQDRRGQQQDVSDITMELCTYFQLPIPVHVMTMQELNNLFHRICVSWFHFQPIHYIATRYLGKLYPEVIEMWEGYIQCFKKYCSERNLREYSSILFNEENQNIFILEIDERYYEMKLSEISRLRESLICVLGCGAISVHLVAVGTGSLLLSFCYCFDDYINKFNLTPRQLKSLAEIKLCRITSLRDKHNQFVYNNIQSYKILPLEYGLRQAEQPSVENVRFEHRIIRTLSVVEQLDLEISGKQLQLLLPFQSIPDTEDAEIQTFTNGAAEINQLWQNVSGKENEVIGLTEVVNVPLKSWNYSNKETGTTNRRREIVSVIETLDLEVQNRLLFPSHLAQEEKEAFLQTMTELKSSVMRKEGELIKLTHEMEKKKKQIKEKEEEAMLLKDEANHLQKELKLSQDSINTYKQLSFKKTMELENMKKQIKELEGNKHSLEKKVDEEAECFKVSLKLKEEEIDRYELKLREEREKNTEINAQLLILENENQQLKEKKKSGISIGVQVSNDSDMPDNIYIGTLLFEKIGSNKWLVRFMIAQNPKILLKYIKENIPAADLDEIIRFSFLDPVNGYIELHTDRSIVKGWQVESHIEPVKLRKRDADLFESDYFPIPPSCLFTVWADLACNPEIRFIHPVILTGIDFTNKIYISRFLETTVPCDTRSANISLGVLRSHYGDLCRLLNGSEPTLNSLTNELFAKGIFDTNVMIDIKKKGANGADILLVHVIMKIEGNAQHLDVVQNALEKEQFLHDIVEKMKKEGQT